MCLADETVTLGEVARLPDLGSRAGAGTLNGRCLLAGPIAKLDAILGVNRHGGRAKDVGNAVNPIGTCAGPKPSHKRE
jgi:hypothetical protein